MKHPFRLAAALILAGATAYPALADQPGADWMSAEQVMSKLTAAGYSDVSAIKADDGHWEGKGMKNGKAFEFEADPHTGAITKEATED